MLCAKTGVDPENANQGSDTAPLIPII